MRHDNLITVYSSTNPGQAEAVRSLLRADGIHCVLGGILRGRSPGVPSLDIQVKVSARLAAAARQRINHYELTRLPSVLPPVSTLPQTVSGTESDA